MKWLVEFTYPVDSVRHPMIQVSDLVIFLVRKFLEMENGYRPTWSNEAKTFFAGCYAKIIDRVRWKTLIEMDGAEQADAYKMLAAVQSTHRKKWRSAYGLKKGALASERPQNASLCAGTTNDPLRCDPNTENRARVGGCMER